MKNSNKKEVRVHAMVSLSYIDLPLKVPIRHERSMANCFYNYVFSRVLNNYI